MEGIFIDRDLLTTDRWRQFLHNTARGLHLYFTLLDHDGGTQAHIPASCPLCGLEHRDLDGTVRELHAGGKAVSLPVLGNTRLFARQCHCAMEESLPPVVERTEIAYNLLANFYNALKDSMEYGQKSIELSTLRRMNQIVLSLFFGDSNALELSYNLILSALVILLDARGSWLELDGITFSKGDITVPKETPDCIQSVVVSIKNCGQGYLGVIEPREPGQAQALMPLMAQEIDIVLEVNRMFRLLQRNLDRVLGSIESAVILVNHRGCITYINTSAAMMLGVKCLRLTGTSINNIPGPWTAALETKTCKRVWGILDTFGEDNMRWIDWEVSPLYEDGEILAWTVLINDRTDFVRCQEATRRADRMATTASMVGALAHELRNPLASAKSLLQLMNRKNEQIKARVYTELAMKELDRVIIMLNEFLMLGKPADISPEPVNLASLWQDIKPLIESEAHFQEVDLTVELGPVPPVSADPRQITQVVLNVVRNAIDASGRNGRVEVLLCQADGNTVLTVRDTGPGIDPKIMDRIFEPFFSTKELGTGLGLTLARAIMDNHGGQIKAHNDPGGGAVFSLLLPSCIMNLENIDVLIISEEKSFRCLVEQLLRSSGLNVLTSSSPEKIPDPAGTIKPAVIISKSPDMDRENTSLISKRWPDSCIIALKEFIGPGTSPQAEPPTLDYARLLNRVRAALADKKA